MDTGIHSATGISINNPLPLNWIGRADAPPMPPAWANIGKLSSKQLRNLQAQIAYDLSAWDYKLIGSDNKLGRYQFNTPVLEAYGLLAPGSNTEYGTDCVNYVHSWRPITVNTGVNAYQNYFYNITSLDNFLSTTVAQEHLAYQRLVDIYLTAIDVGTIKSTDTVDVVAGMMYVSWTLGIGSGPSINSPDGTGAWAWRYNNTGLGINSYNSGRYAMIVLSQ
jgi:hypothetical protein